MWLFLFQAIEHVLTHSFIEYHIPLLQFIFKIVRDGMQSPFSFFTQNWLLPLSFPPAGAVGEDDLNLAVWIVIVQAVDKIIDKLIDPSRSKTQASRSERRNAA